MTTFVIIGLSLLVILLGLGCYFLYRLARIQLDKVALYEEWILSVREDVTDIYRRMIELDEKQWFQKDDDVGVVFRDMIKLIEWLDERVIDTDDE